MNASVAHIQAGGLYDVIQPETTVQPVSPMTSGDLYLSAKGDVTEGRKKALNDAENYLQGIGFFDYFGIRDEPVYLDHNLKKNVLGKTECGIYDGSAHCMVSLRPDLYDISFTDMEEGSQEYFAAKYLQIHTMAHELYHDNLLKSENGIKIVRTLEGLGYSESEVAGVIEMLTEYDLREKYGEAGAGDMALMLEENTPYGKQLGSADYIDKHFEGGMDAFMQYLASDAKDKEILDMYIDDIGVGPVYRSSLCTCPCAKYAS